MDIDDIDTKRTGRIAPHRHDLSDENEEFTPADYFMLSEYEHLTEMLLYTKDVGHKRVQFWLSIVSAAGGLLALLYQIDGGTANFFGTALIAGFALFIVGWMIFLRLVQRTVTIVQYYRGLGKIKHYFAEKDASIKEHLLFPARDDRPSFHHDPQMRKSNLRNLVVIINSFIIAAMAGILPNLIWGKWPAIGLEIILIVAAFGLSYLVHELFAVYSFHKAEKETEWKIRYRHED